jgi:hypothetical protein
VRTAADAMIRGLAMPPGHRDRYFQRVAETIARTQRRNQCAARCHRKAALARLRAQGIRISRLPCCILG